MTLNRIAVAIAATKVVDLEYWTNTLAQRLPGGAGSCVTGFLTKDALDLALRTAGWKPYSHPDIMHGCSAFVTHNLGGHLGIVALSTLRPTDVVVLDDRKGTGQVSATFCSPETLGPVEDFVVIILGPENGTEIVYTFHPGAPIAPSVVAAQPGMHGKEITVQEALTMGFDYAKLVA